MPLLQSLLRATSHRSPLFRTLVPTIGLAFAVQTAFAIPSIALQTDRVYDLSGSITYLGVTALSLCLPALRTRAASTAGVKGALWQVWKGNGNGASLGLGLGWNWRQIALSAAVGVWAARLGTHLFTRLLTHGPDSRFSTITPSIPKFAVAWFFQALWISTCLLPVLSLNALPASLLRPLPILLTDLLGLSLFAFGLGIEVIADRQKARWMQAKREKKHDEDFLSSGLWGRSRHPNYFGECVLWSGVAVAAGGVLVREVAQRGLGLAGLGPWGRVVGGGLAVVSPLFVTWLLLRVSGVPLSEGKYDERFGGREDYRRWKRETPVFLPRFW